MRRLRFPTKHARGGVIPRNARPCKGDRRGLMHPGTVELELTIDTSRFEDALRMLTERGICRPCKGRGYYWWVWMCGHCGGCGEVVTDE